MLTGRPKSSPAAGDSAHQWHALPSNRAVEALQSNADGGLTQEQALERLRRGGTNALPEPRRRSVLSLFLGQFRNPLIYLLFAAAAIALALGHVTDAAVILAVVLLNATVGGLQDGRADRALEALRKLNNRQARVLRGSRQLMVEAAEIVPGDILVLDAGDAVAADARLLDGAALQIAEAALTGESVPVAKELLPLAPDTLLSDRRNMIYAGTHVTAGRARAVVVATGSATEIGRIAALAATAEQPKTPLELRIAGFGHALIKVAAVLFVAINLIGYWRGLPFDQILMVAISQVVGMIPEGLPVAMTIALAVGVQRMARRHAVVRRLAAVETLGSTTVICSDKTGTLTRNEMTVTALLMADGRELDVSGVGYVPEGRFTLAGAVVDPATVADLQTLLEAGVLCNDAKLQGPTADDSLWKPIGDPTEVALITLAIKAGLLPDELRARWPRRGEIPFDAAAKMMATQHDSDTAMRVLLKGAPEVLLPMCFAARHHGQDTALDAPQIHALLEAAQRLASRGLRLLAFGVASGTEIDDRSRFPDFQGRVSFLGVVGQTDPPRPEVGDAVKRCREAGIHPVMVTGDHRATALAVARELGIARDGDVVIDGRELEQLNEAQLAERIGSVAVFARVQPAQKLRIVNAYQQRHEVVAMTGDGVNDAPALVKADVGVAMGLTGTEVAKEAAKIVIADDNFASIVAAVEEGRVVYRNIKKVVLHQFSTSAAEVLVLLLATLLGHPPPFLAVQILWNNLVTEGIVTINLIMEPPEGDEMRRRPIARDEPLLSRMLLTRIGVMVPVMVASTLGWFIVRTAAGLPEAQVRTEAFTLLVICEWFNVLNCRSEKRSALHFDVLRNPWLVGGLLAGIVLQAAVVFWRPLGQFFHTVPLGFSELAMLVVVGSLVLWVEEARKMLVRLRGRRSQSGSST